MDSRSYLITFSQENSPHSETINKLLPIKNGLEAVVFTLNNNHKKVKIGDVVTFEDSISDDEELILKALFKYFCYELRGENQFDDYEKDFKPLFSIVRRSKLSH